MERYNVRLYVSVDLFQERETGIIHKGSSLLIGLVIDIVLILSYNWLPVSHFGAHPIVKFQFHDFLCCLDKFGQLFLYVAIMFPYFLNFVFKFLG